VVQRNLNEEHVIMSHEDSYKLANQLLALFDPVQILNVFMLGGVNYQRQ